LRDRQGRSASFDSSVPYCGFHIGTGYIWNMNEQASLDLYGKYFWTRVQGDDVRLSTGDSVKFEGIDSSRLRFGGRFAYAVNERASPYIGAAYEHEFDGKARASAHGFSKPTVSLRGDTGIGELGLFLKPSPNLPLSIDLSVQAYMGKREGVTGTLQMKYTF
jgi:outer membrane autotransporter protein